MFKKIRNLGDSRYLVARNTSVLALSQIALRVVYIFYIAALARHVGSEGIGMISTATALNGLLVVFFAPGLRTLFVRDVAANPEKADTYLSNMLAIRIFLMVPFVLLSLLFAYGGAYGEDQILIIHMYTVVFITDTITEILLCVFRAWERMELEAGTEVLMQVANIVISLIGISLGWSLFAIVGVSIFSHSLRLVVTFFIVHRNYAKITFKVNFNESRTLFIVSMSFGVLWIIHTFQDQMGTFVLSQYYNAETVGIYSPAKLVISTLLMIPSAFSMAIMPAFSRLNTLDKRTLRKFYQLSYKYLMVLGFPLGVGTMIVGGTLITQIYGEEFSGSTPIIQVMAIFLFTIVGYSNGTFMNVTGQQGFYAKTQALATIFNVTLLFFIVPTYGPVGSAIAFTASGLTTFYIHSRACHNYLDIQIPWLLMGRVLFVAGLMGAALIFSIDLGLNWVIASIVVAPVTYGACLIFFRIVNMEELKILAGDTGRVSKEKVEAEEANSNEDIANDTPAPVTR
ncbi:MAG: flippase [Aggregatilineales bacterium]